MRRRGPQRLRTRELDDCPACASGYRPLPRRPRRDVVPWNERKGPAGQKKRIDTTGCACMNPNCNYRWITDPSIHALVSDSYLGVRKDILYLKCRTCGKKKTSRLDTLSWMNTLIRAQPTVKWVVLHIYPFRTEEHFGPTKPVNLDSPTTSRKLLPEKRKSCPCRKTHPFEKSGRIDYS